MPDDAIERARQIMIEELRKAGCRAPLDQMIQPFLQAGVRAALAFASQQAPNERAWTPHFDYAGEPMREGHFRDPPEGWRLVPIDPTDAMIEAAGGACINLERADDPSYEPAEVWSAMLDAAPSVTLGEVG